ncbi:peptidoglycan/xylan/chitin deacetylase (PgdA/CDA1 family) [Catalinimonas alkaloidigena]|uniref:polysaccharide deacetylase family protein n=1 Tax=Catalinimonas alkaloidigena TaxID=1075417 RepID=UPI002407529D|nr:polysaccharide deacetylase family protein [Catalinimonas alkaloidigena]MDF9801228.1 peptidoglycan/xylan/chitin deacetylase (PgdA/CDA1 family) [Catalinimonas alkaloidigena]
MNFFKTPSLLKLLYSDLLWDYKKENGKQIFLTFDDGPIPEVTPIVLDTLKDFGAKATFFCVGENIDRYPQVYQQILDAGHRTGNHTYNHLNGWKTENTHYLENVTYCRQSQEQYSHESEKPLFRPPYGKIKRSQIKLLKNEYQIVMWDILAGDFDPDFSAEKCLQKCIHHSKHGTIIIFHDSHKAAKNLKYVLPRYLAHFSEAGFQFSAL